MLIYDGPSYNKANAVYSYVQFVTMNNSLLNSKTKYSVNTLSFAGTSTDLSLETLRRYVLK